MLMVGEAYNDKAGRSTIVETIKMYINGSWVHSRNKERIEVKNPSNSEIIATIPCGNIKDIDDAVKSAKKAFNNKAWRKVKPHERGYVVFEIAEKIRENRDELAELETMDVGKPRS